jgi:very-short-patch-repair endonuclease
LVIELDGNSHDAQLDYDARRNAYLGKNGYQVLRSSNQQVFENIEGVVAIIEHALTRLPTPSPSRLQEGGTSQ